MTERFTVGIDAWEAKLEFTRNLVRQELVAQQLAAHLPSPAPDVSILDVGCGQGTQALELARKGYQVVGLDPSLELLGHANAALQQKSPELKNRIGFVRGSLDEVPNLLSQQFDIVCCHGVLMYLPELNTSIKTLLDIVKPGGKLSVLTRNQAGIAMRAGMMQDWPLALESFDARHYDNRVGVKSVRADTLEEVLAACEVNNAHVEAWYGVRLFTDHWDDIELPEDFKTLLAVEAEAGRRDPYRRLASLTHVIARKK
jgi:S-adenosylmethionine-dependent methyltransferase